MTAGRVLADERRPDPLCDECGGSIDGDPCHPHDRDCPRVEWGIGWDCDCDNDTHPDCCWQCHPSPQEVPA